MSRMSRFGGPSSGNKITKVSGKGVTFVDHKDVESLRRLLSPNGKILGRKRLGLTARDQRLAAQAIKRARYLGLLPYTSATI